MHVSQMAVCPKVIDTSHWDDVTDKFAGTVQAGIKGVINKVTEGLGGKDHSFDWRLKPAQDAGLLYGGFHFLRPGRIVEQADWFVQNLGGNIDKLLIAADHEDRRVSLRDLQIWLTEVHRVTGRWPVLYSGFLIKEQMVDLRRGAEPEFWGGIKLWLSHYSSKPKWPAPWLAPWLWQYTGDGLGPGPHGVPGVKPADGLDMNSYAGSDEQLAREWAQ